MAPILPAPSPLRLEPVKWQVVSVEEQTKFALDADNYEALSRNIAAMVRWATEASWQLDFYRRTRSPAQTGGQSDE